MTDFPIIVMVLLGWRRAAVECDRDGAVAHAHDKGGGAPAADEKPWRGGTAGMTYGLTFSETMAGAFTLDEDDPRRGAERGRRKGHSLTLQAKISISDLDAFLSDPEHAAGLTGRVGFPPVGATQATQSGRFKLFSPSDDPTMKLMVYEMGFRAEGADYYLVGRKEVRDDPGFDLWSDTTTLLTTLHKGTDESGRIVGAGVLTLGVQELIDMVSTFRVTGGASASERAAAIARFGGFFLGELWNTYAGFARERRPPPLEAFEPQEMVRWFDPVQLVQTAIRAVLAAIFGDYADKREALAAHSRDEPGAKPYFDYSTRDAEDGFWLDFVADLGDGFDSTYTLAYLLAQEELTPELGGPTRRGDVLVMGGDEVYPTPSRESYRNRTTGPYRAALPWSGDSESRQPHLFATPGNHDWYDGLTSFARVFCQRRLGGAGGWIGGWRTRQSRSYFALKLPGNWWLWGIDIQLGGYIDQPQLHYFEEIASKYLRPERIDGVMVEARVILCTAEPSWVYTKTKGGGAYKNLAYMEALIHPHGELGLTLTGDLHHYSRYTLEESDEGGVTRHMITSGGGGAFLSPTHKLPEQVALETSLHPGQYECVKVYPKAETSSSLAWRNLAFPFYNRKFLFTLGALYFLLAWIMESAAMGLGWSLLQYMGEALERGLGGWAIVSKVWTVFRNSPASMMALALMVYGLYSFCKVPNKVWKFVLGIAHAFAHLALLLALMSFFGFLNLKFRVMDAPDFFRVVVFTVEMVVVGGFVGALLMGLYLLLSLNVFGGHWIEAFSSLRIANYKNFLRIHIVRDGSLTVHAIGIDRVLSLGRGEWHDRGPSTTDGPRFKPANGSSLSCHLIETIPIPPARAK